MAKKKQTGKKTIRNRRAAFDYNLEDSFMAGLVLSGAETKSLRLGHGHLRGAYVTARDSELWLINATITGFSGVKLEEAEQTRARKLLLKKREIEQLLSLKQQGKTIVPLELITGGRYIKIRISAGRGKKRYDKRETIKRREQNRAARATLKNHF